MRIFYLKQNQKLFNQKKPITNKCYRFLKFIKEIIILLSQLLLHLAIQVSLKHQLFLMKDNYHYQKENNELKLNQILLFKNNFCVRNNPINNQNNFVETVGITTQINVCFARIYI